MEDSAHVCIVPVEFTYQLEDFVDCFLGKNIVDKVPNEELDRWPVFLLTGRTLWRIALQPLDDYGYSSTHSNTHLIVCILK